MLKDALTRWIAPAITGDGHARAAPRRRLLDPVDTRAEYMAYAPDKLSMERVEEPAFTPEDRIGALEMQNLSVTDNRAFLVHHLSTAGHLAAGTERPLAALLSVDEDDADKTPS